MLNAIFLKSLTIKKTEEINYQQYYCKDCLGSMLSWPLCKSEAGTNFV